MKVRLLLGLVVAMVVAVGIWPAPAGADPFKGPPICSSAGVAVSGSHGNLTIRGNAYVPGHKTLRVRGNLWVAPGACLDAFTKGTVKVAGNVVVGKGAVLALGCTPQSIGPVPPCGNTTTKDVVGGSILADRPLTMYLDGDTIGGNVISNGGGPGLHGTFLNFPVKDNTIGGNLVIQGWRGGWVGSIRNTVAGNVVFSNNKSVADPDSNEVQTNDISGNLVCRGNSPATHVNPDDGGLPNTVAGRKIAQCAKL